MRGLSIATLALLAICVDGCVPADDAGDVAFVHQAVSTLLGRRPHGSAEVTALKNLIATGGRAAVVDALLEEPELVEYWSLVLADSMQIQRGDDLQQLPACVTAPSFLTESGVPCSSTSGDCGVKATALASRVADTLPGTVGADVDGDGTDDVWNLHDAIRAALLTDNLHVAYRPYLFALGSPHQSAPLGDRRDNLLSTVFDVRSDCVSCHSSTYSKTEVYDDYAVADPNTWDRASTIGRALEVDAFGGDGSVDDDGTARYDCYEAACSSCHGPTGNQYPRADAKPKKLSKRVPLLTRSAIASIVTSGSGTKDANGDPMMSAKALTIWPSCTAMCPPDNLLTKHINENTACTTSDAEMADLLAGFLQEQLGGYEELDKYLTAGQYTIEDPLNPGLLSSLNGPWNMDTSCGFAWSSDTSPVDRPYWFAGDSTTTPNVRNIAGSIKTGLLSFPTFADLEADLDHRANTTLPQFADPDTAAAVLFVGNIADDILEEISGARSTLAHGQPRTYEQSYARAKMIDALVVTDADGTARISLKAGLRTALLSNIFNRKSPSASSLPTAYEMPVAANPWALTEDPLETANGANANGQGDLVYRRSPNQLLFSVAKDLGWPAPAVWPGSGGFPNEDLSGQIGRYRSHLAPGSKIWQFDSMLYWEQKVASCKNPTSTPDWIDLLLDKVYPPLIPAIPVTMETLALSLRDRLLQRPSFDVLASGASEATLVAALFEPKVGPNALAVNARTKSRSAVDAALRAYCGALLLSPDYTMNGLPTVTADATPPTFTVCLTGEPCSVTEYESHYQ